MPITHYGSFTVDTAADLMSVSTTGSSVALTASGTFPANAITGAGNVTLVNTTNTPGTITTRTASQMFADLAAQLGIQPPSGFAYALRITHSGSGTLTLSAGTGVTFGTGTYTVATNTFRDFYVTVTNAGAFTIQTTGVGTWS
jgi:hypothetical protein